MELTQELDKKEKAMRQIKAGDSVHFDGERFRVVEVDKQRIRIDVIQTGSGVEMSLPPQHIERHNGHFF